MSATQRLRKGVQRYAAGTPEQSSAIRYEDLLDVADTAQHWYAGQGDPVYALVSSVYAGQDVPISIAEDALSNLERDHRQLRARRSEGWRKDYDELGRTIDELSFRINEARSSAARMSNPVTAGEGWSVALLLLGVFGLVYVGTKPAAATK